MRPALEHFFVKQTLSASTLFFHTNLQNILNTRTHTRLPQISLVTLLLAHTHTPSPFHAHTHTHRGTHTNPHNSSHILSPVGKVSWNWGQEKGNVAIDLETMFHIFFKCITCCGPWPLRVEFLLTTDFFGKIESDWADSIRRVNPNFGKVVIAWDHCELWQPHRIATASCKL